MHNIISTIGKSIYANYMFTFNFFGKELYIYDFSDLTISNMIDQTQKPYKFLKSILISIIFVYAFSLIGISQDQNSGSEIDNQLWQEATELASNIMIIDGHSHDLLKPVSSRFPKQVNFNMAKETGINGIANSLPIDPRKKENPSAYIISELKQLDSLLNNRAVQILNAEGFHTAQKEDKLALLIGLEYSYGMFEGQTETLQKYYDLGVRSVCLSNRGKDTLYYASNNQYQISDFGFKLLEEMNRLGVAIDITHTPEAVRSKIVDISKAPAYVSHANVQGVVAASFNVSDSLLYRLTSKGGVVCLTFYSEYVSEECLAQKGKAKSFKDMPRAKLEEFIDHIDYFKETVGIDYVCLGSDYGGSGRIAPNGLETIEGFPMIIYHMLKRGYSKEEIEKVMGLNFINYLKRVEANAKLSY